EDGIRDFHVTGVQTCALPILLNIIEAGKVKVSANYGSVRLQIRLACASELSGTYRTVNVGTGGTLNYQVTITEIEPLTYQISDRSEERRVGKERITGSA